MDLVSGCEVGQDEEGFSHVADVREEASAAAEALAARVEAAGEVDLAYWVATRPAYGSAAYVADVAGMSDADRAA